MRHKTSVSRSPSRKSAKGGTLLGVFIGLILGILMALVVVWYINRTPAPFKTPGGQVESAMPAARDGQIPAAPVPLPGKPGDPPQEKRFQFYDILPGKSEPKPDAKPASKAPGAPTPPVTKAEAKASGPLSLQVGSFQTMKDAENMKATLAMMGVEPAIQEVQVNGKQWYRVRVGPMISFEELNKLKAELAKSGIQAVVVKPNE